MRDKIKQGLCAGIVVLPLLLAVTPTLAERYRVDLILFADKTGAGEERPLPAQLPDLSNALEPFDTAHLKAAGIEVLPDEAFGLSDQWKRLNNSKQQQPILRLAWIQKDPPAEHGVGLRLHSGSALSLRTDAGNGSMRNSEIYPIDGSVTLLVSRFLHLDADLAYTQSSGAGDLSSFRLHERRRMRREEVHHLDSPRLGLLVRVQKVKSEEKGKG